MSLNSRRVACEFCGKIIIKTTLSTHYNTKRCSEIRMETGRYKDPMEQLCAIINTLRDSGKDVEYFFDNCFDRDIDIFTFEGCNKLSDAVYEYIEG